MLLLPGSVLGHALRGVLCLALLAAPLPAAAQGDDPLATAHRQIQERQWFPAQRTLEAALEHDPTNGELWALLATAYASAGGYSRAAEAQANAVQYGHESVDLTFEAATTHVRINELDRALDYLERAVELGATASRIEADPMLERLADHPRYLAALEGARINEAPCAELPVYREFDFWVGEWVVVDADGNKLGENSIRKASNGCVLLESWEAIDGGVGRSINYYDPGRKKWVQIWVDGGAEVIPTEGGIEGGAMRLTGEHLYRDGRKERFRGTWSPLADGRVRQLLEQSADGGKTWYVWFDGYYVRKGGGKP